MRSGFDAGYDDIGIPFTLFQILTSSTMTATYHASWMAVISVTTRPMPTAPGEMGFMRQSIAGSLPHGSWLMANAGNPAVVPASA